MKHPNVLGKLGPIPTNCLDSDKLSFSLSAQVRGTSKHTHSAWSFYGLGNKPTNTSVQRENHNGL